MAKTFKVEIVTPEAVVLSVEAESLVVPAERGYLGVLAGHAPLLCSLQPGEIRLREPGKDERGFATSGGFMEVVPGKASLLTENAEESVHIDVPRAEESKKRAEARLASTEKGVDRERARAALDRARNRLALVKRRRK
jgi:F-type H+-transporting ATPase subunit epsilon